MRENILNVMGVCVDRLASSAKSPFGYSVHAAIIGFSLSSKSLSIKKWEAVIRGHSGAT